MGYEVAINKAWNDLLAGKPAKNLSVKFLGDEYTVDSENRRILSISCKEDGDSPLQGQSPLTIDLKNFQGFTPLETIELQAIDARSLTGFTFKILTIEPITNPQSVFGSMKLAEADTADQPA